MARFRYDPAILERFPTVVGGVLHATGVANGPTPPALAEAFRAEAVAVRARIGDKPLSELPTLAAWRRVFRRFGVDPTQYRSAAEALLRRLAKQGELPSIGTLCHRRCRAPGVEDESVVGDRWAACQGVALRWVCRDA